MAGIPLPALAIHGPDPAEMMNAFLGVGRLQQQAAGQVADFRIAQQQNAMAQQRLTMEQQKQQAAMQQLAQQQQDAKVFNEGLAQYYKNGKVDTDGLSQYLQEHGYQGNILTALQSAGTLQELHQKLEQGEIKNIQDKAGFITRVAPSWANLPAQAAYQIAQHAAEAMDDKDSQKWLSSITPDQLHQYLVQQAMSQAPIVKVGPGQALMQRDPATGQLVTVGQGPEPTPKPRIFSGMINGQPGVATIDPSTGKYNVIPGLRPNPSFTEVYGPVAAARAVEQPTAKFVDNLATVDAVLNAINQGESGSQLANGALAWLGSMMTTGIGGIKRLNMVEISQMSPSAQSAARRIEAGWDKFLSGKVPPGYVNDLKTLAESYKGIIYRRYIDNLVGSTASFPGGIDSINALTPDGNGYIPLRQAMESLSKPAATAGQAAGGETVVVGANPSTRTVTLSDGSSHTLKSQDDYNKFVAGAMKGGWWKVGGQGGKK
jgi:hypothetical protein